MSNANLAENTLNNNAGNETTEARSLEEMVNKIIAELVASTPGATAEMIRNDKPNMGLIHKAAEKRIHDEEKARKAKDEALKAEEEARQMREQQLMEDVQRQLCAKLGLGQAPKRTANTDVKANTPPTEVISNLIPFKGGRGDETSSATEDKKIAKPFALKQHYTLTEAAALRGVLIRGLQGYKVALLNDTVKENPEMTEWMKGKIGEIQSAIDFIVDNFGEDTRRVRANHAEFDKANDDLWYFGGKLSHTVFTSPHDLWQEENTVNSSPQTAVDKEKSAFRAAVTEMIGKIITNPTDVTALADKVVKKAYTKGATPTQALREMATNRQLAHEDEGGTGVHSTAHIYAKAANMADDDLIASVVEKRRQIEKPAPMRPADYGICKKVPQPKKRAEESKKGQGRRERNAHK